MLQGLADRPEFYEALALTTESPSAPLVRSSTVGVSTTAFHFVPIHRCVTTSVRVRTMASSAQSRPAGSVVLFLTPAAFQSLAASWQNLDRTFSVPLNTVGNCAALGQLPSSVAFNGLDLMLDIGSACTRPDIFDDPSPLFALFKYAATIAVAPGLTLKAEIRDADFHKKTLMSDEFGCGGAFVAARRVLGAQWFADFNTAIRYGWVRTTAPRSRRPDYACQSAFGSAELTLLEAKGTQTSREYCENTQIASGCAQLQSVRLVDPTKQISRRAAIGLALRRTDDTDDSAFYIGDPKEGEKTYAYSLEEDFDQIALKSHYLRLAALYGDSDLTSKIIERPAQAGRAQTAKRFGDREVIGTSCLAISAIGTIELFTGIDAEVRQILSDDKNVEKVAAAGLEAHQAFNRIGGGIASTPDGAVLSVSVTRA
jgi:hypothetical protein